MFPETSSKKRSCQIHSIQNTNRIYQPTSAGTIPIPARQPVLGWYTILDSISIQIGHSRIGGSIIRRTPPFQIDMSIQHWELCSDSQNPHAYGKSTSTKYSRVWGSPQWSINHASTLEWSLTKAPSSCNRSMTLLSQRLLNPSQTMFWTKLTTFSTFPRYARAFLLFTIVLTSPKQKTTSKFLAWLILIRSAGHTSNTAGQRAISIQIALLHYQYVGSHRSWKVDY